MAREETTEHVKFPKWFLRVMSCVFVVVLAVVPWAVALSIEVSTKVSTDDTIKLINTHAPYVEDRKLIMEKMVSNSSINEKLSDEIKSLREVLLQLKVELKYSRPNRE